MAAAASPPDMLDAAFGALADRTRRAMLQRLAKGEATVNELAAPFDMSQPSISRHLKVLEEAGLIEAGTRSAQFRPRRLRPETLRAARAWMDELRGMWADSFDKLDGYLDEIERDMAGKASPKKRKGKRNG